MIRFYLLSIVCVVGVSHHVHAGPANSQKKSKKVVIYAIKNKSSRVDPLQKSSSDESMHESRSLSIDTTLADESLSGELSVYDIGIQTSTPETRRLFNNIFVAEQAVVCDDTLTQRALSNQYACLDEQYRAIPKNTFFTCNNQDSGGLSLQGQRYAQASLKSLKDSIDSFDKD